MNRNHVITIDQEVVLMNTQMKKPPKLLHKFAGKESCCIFRLPKSIVEINKEAYEPRIVSIGPYHHGKEDLQMIQEHKWRYLNDMITRTRKPLEVFMRTIVLMEDAIRQSYSECIDHISTNDLTKMMVLDGIFLIELFRKVGQLVGTDHHDPLFRMGWVSPFLMRDLLRIENQIPFFVLQKLFDVSIEINYATKPDDHTLPSLILGFFNYAVDRPKEVLVVLKKLEGKHLLDFIRKSFINTKEKKPIIPKANDILKNHSLKLFPPATKLKIVGVKFKANDGAKSFLDIEFRNGVLLIPQLNMDDFYSSFFLNCVAFEQCYNHCSKHITTYVVFMGCIMNTSIDVGLLSESKVIENYFGTDKEIATFFKNVGKDVAFDNKNHYLFDLFTEVNVYCNTWRHVHWAGFKHTYFESPWSAISAFAAFLLLSLAALQTFYTVHQYYNLK